MGTRPCERPRMDRDVFPQPVQKQEVTTEFQVTCL